MRSTLSLFVAVACLSAAAVYQVTVLADNSSGTQLKPLLPGNVAPFDIANLRENQSGGCKTAFLVDPDCPASRALAEQAANWSRDEYAHYHWIVSGDRSNAVTFRDRHLLPADETLFLDDLSSGGSSLVAIRVFASPTRILVGPDGVVRAVGIATRPYTQDELSKLCNS